MYVDDLLMWSIEDKHMMDLVQFLNKAGVGIEQEIMLLDSLVLS